MSEKQDFGNLMEQQASLRLQFIQIELDLGMTFCHVADTTENRETAGRNTENARRACDTAEHALRQGTELKFAERQEVDGKLAELKGMLTRLEQGEDWGKKADGSR